MLVVPVVVVVGVVVRLLLWCDDGSESKTLLPTKTVSWEPSLRTIAIIKTFRASSFLPIAKSAKGAKQVARGDRVIGYDTSLIEF